MRVWPTVHDTGVGFYAGGIQIVEEPRPVLIFFIDIFIILFAILIMVFSMGFAERLSGGTVIGKKVN